MAQKRKRHVLKHEVVVRRGNIRMKLGYGDSSSSRKPLVKRRKSRSDSEAVVAGDPMKIESITHNANDSDNLFQCETCLCQYFNEAGLMEHVGTLQHQRELTKKRNSEIQIDNFSRLPPEIYKEIFSHVPWMEKRNVFLVNNTWLELAKSVFPTSRDVAFVCDITGSMRSHTQLIRKRIAEFMEQEVKKDSRFAFIGYKDHDSSNNTTNPVTTTFSFARDPQMMLNFIDQLPIGGGGDEAEAVVDGLKDALNLKWRGPSVEKAIVLFLDAPAHGTCSRTSRATDNYPNGCPCGVKEEDLLREMEEKNIRLCIIPFSDSLEEMFELLRKTMPSLLVKSQDTKLEDCLSGK